MIYSYTHNQNDIWVKVKLMLEVHKIENKNTLSRMGKKATSLLCLHGPTLGNMVSLYNIDVGTLLCLREYILFTRVSLDLSVLTRSTNNP